MSDVVVTVEEEIISLTLTESEILAIELNQGLPGPQGDEGPQGPQGDPGPPVGDGNPLTIAGWDIDGHFGQIPSLFLDTEFMGLHHDATINPAAQGGGRIWNIQTLNLNPAEDSPNDLWNMNSYFFNIDSASEGFSLGDSGNAAYTDTYNIQHHGKSDIGGLTFRSNYFDLGNGTDPISIKGLAFQFGFGDINAGVTINGPIQGYGHQWHAHAGAVLENSVIAYADFATTEVDVHGWTSFIASPQIAAIANNTNCEAFMANAQIGELKGNSGYTGLGVFPHITKINQGNFGGVKIQPTIDDGNQRYAAGLFIDMRNITNGDVSQTFAADLIGNVRIDGSLSFSGGLSIGQLQAFFQQTAADGGGNPQGFHGLVTSLIGPANTTTNNCDAIGVNTAMLMEIRDNSINHAGPFGLGFAALALPCVIETHTGSITDFVSAAVYALNMSGTSTGGTIGQANLCRSIVIPNGITTIEKVKGFIYEEPFGPAGNEVHGFYNSSASSHNFFASNLKIGGADKVASDSIALEIESTTQAVVLSRLTTTQRDDLTATNGMMIYNITDGEFQGYKAGAWVNL
jgi:hypothetical protein